MLNACRLLSRCWPIRRLISLIGPATRFEDLPRAMPALLGLVPAEGPAPLCPLITYA